MRPAGDIPEMVSNRPVKPGGFFCCGSRISIWRKADFLIWNKTLLAKCVSARIPNRLYNGVKV